MVVAAAAVAAWWRDLVVLLASVGALVFLSWTHCEPQGYAFVTRQKYEAMRGSLLTSHGVVTGGALLVAGERTKAR